jgi:hypothetical protein
MKTAIDARVGGDGYDAIGSNDEGVATACGHRLRQMTGASGALWSGSIFEGTRCIAGKASLRLVSELRLDDAGGRAPETR